MSTVRNFSYFVEASEKFCDDAVGCLLAVSFQQVKPDRLDIENRIFSEPKWIQFSASIRQMRFL